jgi:hypothetical protein
VLAYSALRIFWPHTWYYYPLHLVHCAFFGVGFERGVRRLLAAAAGRGFDARIRMVLAAGAAGLLLVLVALGTGAVYGEAQGIDRAFFAGGRDALYKAAGGWLERNPERCASIAALEVGTLAYYSDRILVDRMGLITPRAGAEMKRTNARETSIAWTAAEFRPACFVFAGVPRAWPASLGLVPDYTLARIFAHGPSRSELAIYAR